MGVVGNLVPNVEEEGELFRLDSSSKCRFADNVDHDVSRQHPHHRCLPTSITHKPHNEWPLNKFQRMTGDVVVAASQCSRRVPRRPGDSLNPQPHLRCWIKFVATIQFCVCQWMEWNGMAWNYSFESGCQCHGVGLVDAGMTLITDRTAVTMVNGVSTRWYVIMPIAMWLVTRGCHHHISIFIGIVWTSFGGRPNNLWNTYCIHHDFIHIYIYEQTVFVNSCLY